MNEELESKISDLEKLPEDELMKIIGAYALDQSDQAKKIGINKRKSSTDLEKAAKRYFRKIRPILVNTICGPDGIAHYAEQATVKDIIVVLLPVLGISTLGIVPTAVIAISIIIVRSGIREFCKKYSRYI